MSAICYRCMTGTATVATSNYASQRSESARAVHPLRTSRGAGFESSQANRGQALQAGHQGIGAYTHTTHTLTHIHTHIDTHTVWTVYSKQQWRCSWCDVCYLLVQTVDALRGMYLPSLSKYPFAARLGRVATDHARPCAVLCGLLDPSQPSVFLCCAV